MLFDPKMGTVTYRNALWYSLDIYLLSSFTEQV